MSAVKNQNFLKHMLWVGGKKAQKYKLMIGGFKLASK